MQRRRMHHVVMPIASAVATMIVVAQGCSSDSGGDGGSIRCGAGTVLSGDQCVAPCGPGTVMVGGQCVVADGGGGAGGADDAAGGAAGADASDSSQAGNAGAGGAGGAGAAAGTGGTGGGSGVGGGAGTSGSSGGDAAAGSGGAADDAAAEDAAGGLDPLLVTPDPNAKACTVTGEADGMCPGGTCRIETPTSGVCEWADLFRPTGSKCVDGYDCLGTDACYAGYCRTMCKLGTPCGDAGACKDVGHVQFGVCVP